MKVIVTDRDGREHVLEALEGWRVMEVIRDWGIPIRAECCGAGICGTCHVHVDRDWIARLPEPGEDEHAVFDKLADADATSRLSCQILMSEELDGLRVRLAADAETEAGADVAAQAA